MTITGILEDCMYGDPSLRALAKSVNFAAQIGIGAIPQGMPAGQLTSISGFIPSAPSQYQRMVGRLFRKGQGKP